MYNFGMNYQETPTITLIDTATSAEGLLVMKAAFDVYLAATKEHRGRPYPTPPATSKAEIERGFVWDGTRWASPPATLIPSEAPIAVPDNLNAGQTPISVLAPKAKAPKTLKGSGGPVAAGAAPVLGSLLDIPDEVEAAPEETPVQSVITLAMVSSAGLAAWNRNSVAVTALLAQHSLKNFRTCPPEKAAELFTALEAIK